MATVRGFDFPDDLFYMVEHDIWARPDTDGALTVGLTTLGCHVSGEFIEFMPKSVGTFVERDRAMAVLEMSKTVRSARAPASGTIVGINDRVKRQLSLLNSDPYGDGWLLRLMPVDWAQDSKSLVNGSAIGPAVERYMELYLIPAFGEDAGRAG